MHMNPFIYNARPGRVIFGAGTIARLEDELAALGATRALVLSTPFQETYAQSLVAENKDKCVGIFAGAAMHTPVSVTETAMKQVAALDADCIVSFGGGSTTGLGKAIALRTDLPQIVIPTTYAGSEMTPILGETQDGQKRTMTSPKVLPEVVIYDIELTMSLPVGMSGTSGINAIAHAVEALYARDSNPVISLIALEGITALYDALPRIASDPSDPDARGRALYGAWLCGMCLGSVGMALHHKLCHTVGGSFDLPHAETHTVILPHALAYNAPAVPDVIGQLGAALKTSDPVLALYELAQRIGAPTSLQELGMPEDGIDLVVKRAASNPYWNPQPLEAAGLKTLIDNAYHGRPPAVSRD